MNSVDEYLWTLLGVAGFSLIAYLALKLYALKHPFSFLARPKAVRDVWIVINGSLLGIVLIGLITMVVSLTVV